MTASHLSFLDGISPDEFLIKPIMACAMGAMANRENDSRGKEAARRYYVEAITATNAALRHPRKVREDNTIVAVALLSVFEVRILAELSDNLILTGVQRIMWEKCTSFTSWGHHVRGASQILQFRGRSQIRTKTGALLFRCLRDNIVSILVWTLFDQD